MSRSKRVIWIDLENTPHVPFFCPIIRELERSGCEVILTARDFAQTVELAQRAGLKAMVVSSGGARSTPAKAVALLTRAVRLAWKLRGKKIHLAVGHGSRGMVMASKLLRVPSLTLYDYEGASVRLFNRLSSFVMTPELVTDEILAPLGLEPSRHLTYPGLKEEVYLHDTKPSTTLPVRLGLRREDINVVVRPPSDTAHYRSDRSNQLFEQIMQLLEHAPGVHVVLLPRDAAQRARMQTQFGRSERVTIPDRAIDGVSLLCYTDLVIGGGGTMNREAALLGVLVLSIFKGAEGAVDRWLKEQGKFVDIDRASDAALYVKKRARDRVSVSSHVLETIVQTIQRLSEAKA